jgi:hypothetical protein
MSNSKLILSSLSTPSSPSSSSSSAFLSPSGWFTATTTTPPPTTTTSNTNINTTLLFEHLLISPISFPQSITTPTTTTDNNNTGIFRFPIAICPFGGPIAIRKNQSTIIYTATGNLVREWPRDEYKIANGKSFGWLSDGTLALLLQDGSVVLHTDFNSESATQRGIQKLSDSPTSIVLTSLIWEHGIVFVTTSCTVVAYVLTKQSSPEADYMPFILTKTLETRVPIVPERPPRSIIPCRPWISFSRNEDTRKKNIQFGLSLYDQPGMLVVGTNVGGYGINFVPKVPDSKLRLAPSLILKSHPTLPIIGSYGLDDVLIVCSWNWDIIYYSIHTNRLHTSGSLLMDLEWCFRYCSTDSSSNNNLILCSFWRSPRDTSIRIHVMSTLTTTNTNTSSTTIDNSTSINNNNVIHLPQRDFMYCVEIDGIRMITNTTSSLIRLVPASIQSVYKLGSVSPPAMLLAALDALEAKEPDADTMLRAIDEMYVAITGALSASRCELDTIKRARLLRAASLGASIFNTSLLLEAQGVDGSHQKQSSSSVAVANKSIPLPLYHSQITEIAHKLKTYAEDARACTSVLELGIGTITPIELACLTRKIFVARCARLCDYPVAIGLAKWLNVDTSPIRALAAYDMIRKKNLSVEMTSTNSSNNTTGGLLDEKSTLLMSVCDMIGNDRGGPVYCATARVAREKNLIDLAFQLCTRDPSLERRVLFLLSCNEADRALSLLESAKGVDPELVLRASLYRARHCAPPAPGRDHPVTDSALRRSLKHRDPAALERVLLNDVTRLGTKKAKSQAAQERATLLAESALKRLATRGEDFLSTDETKFTALLMESAREYEAAAGRGENAKHCRDFARLSQMQKSLLSITMVGLSLADTIIDCIARQREDLAEKFRKEFDLQPKSYHHYRVRGLLQRGAIGEIFRLLKEDKEFNRCITWEILIEQSFSDGNLVAAASIAYEIPIKLEAELKALTFVRLHMYKEALEVIGFEPMKHKDVYLRVAKEIISRNNNNNELVDRAKTIMKELMELPDQNPLVATVTSNVGDMFATLSWIGDRWRKST